MPFLIDTTRVALGIFVQALIWAAKLGFETREYHIRRSRLTIGIPGRHRNWKIVMPGWSRFLRLHYLAEREHGRVYVWL